MLIDFFLGGGGGESEQAESRKQAASVGLLYDIGIIAFSVCV